MEFPLKPGRITAARVSQANGRLSLVIGSGTMLSAPKSFSGTSPSDIRSVDMLGVDETLEWSVEDDGLKVNPPAKKPCDYAYVIKIVKN